VNPEPFAALTLARVLRPWGRRGQVAAQILTDFPKRLTAMREAWLSDGRNPPRRVAIVSCRVHLGQAIFHFAGVESITDAERLRGLEVQVPLAERAPIAPDRHYIDDLVGCAVWEQGAAASLGTVQEVQRASESSLLVVATSQGELLVPLAAEICVRIDTAARRIEVRLPEGLLELNARPPAHPSNDRPTNDRLNNARPNKVPPDLV
jgi:16S rRNA processing protein RimM